jgi:hypothetical protein
MAIEAQSSTVRHRARWRVVLWGTAALVLLLPLAAMPFTAEVDWDLADFAIFGGMLIGACGIYELSARQADDPAYRAAVGVALAAAFALVWMNLAVGVLGDEGNPANLMYGGVLAVGVIGAIVARFQPRGMARTSMGMALVQVLVAAISIVAGWGSAVILTGLFVGLWLTSALLFRKAARKRVSMDTER